MTTATAALSWRVSREAETLQMSNELVMQMADFVSDVAYSRLPSDVTEESKRLILDSVGCALGGVEHPKGRIGIEYGIIAGGNGDQATIFGSRHRSSVVGAGFANGELINALDFDAILPPGHVSPYVLPGIFAVGENVHSNGQALLSAVAISHEMSYRMGKAMDYIRDTEGGEMSPPPVLGYASTIFGAVAGIAKLRGVERDVTAHALAIAAAISPVQPHQAWNLHMPSATIKYFAAGPIVQAALAAAFMAELGHTGDLQILDDRDFGYAKFIGTRRWVPEAIVDQVGKDWRFPPDTAFKLYPHCRVMANPFDALLGLLTEHDIKPDEISAVRVWGEGHAMAPLWLNKNITKPHEVQFSMAHGVAVAAQRIPPGKAWQDPELIFSRPVLDLMEKVTVHAHPEYVSELGRNPAARATRVEVDARGTTFSVERLFPRGSLTADPATRVSNDELVEKFHRNAEGVIGVSDAEAVVEAVLNLEDVDDVAPVFRRLGATVPAGQAVPA
jgi:2-methylcitrate dehydratase PrpD